MEILQKKTSPFIELFFLPPCGSIFEMWTRRLQCIDWFLVQYDSVL